MSPELKWVSRYKKGRWNFLFQIRITFSSFFSESDDYEPKCHPCKFCLKSETRNGVNFGENSLVIFTLKVLLNFFSSFRKFAVASNNCCKQTFPKILLEMAKFLGLVISFRKGSDNITSKLQL